MKTETLDDALTVFAGHRPQLRVRRPGQSRAHGGRGAGAPGPRRRHPGLGGAVPAPASTTRRRRAPAPDRDGVAGRARARDHFPEWLALFEREIADRPVAAVVGEWAPRLLPGSVGAATHGLIRTGHAVRGSATPTRRRGASRWRTPWPSGPAATRSCRATAADRARRRGGAGRPAVPPRDAPYALAFWASSYQELPGPPLLIGHEGVAQALADLPYLEDPPAAVLISDRVAAVADIADEFEQAVASLGWTGSAVDLLDQLATGGALAYLRNADDGGADRPPARGDVAAGLRAGAALAGGGGQRRRPGLRLAGGGGLARRLRHRPARAGAHGDASVDRRPRG